MKTIQSREDIVVLVNKFYDKIRRHDLLGPIFNMHIPEEKWPMHLEKLANFWETNLFGILSFKGNPTLKHINVDKNLSHSIEQKHFGQWLQLWFETIDELFEGDIADKAKESARRMAHSQFLMIWKNREHN